MKFNSTPRIFPIFFYLFYLILHGCFQTRPSFPSEIVEIVSKAGKNKNELEKILLHYSKSPSDSLKLQAVYFLISEMQYKGSFYKFENIPTPVSDAYFSMDSFVRQNYFNPFSNRVLVSDDSEYRSDDSEYRSFTHHLKSNIDEYRNKLNQNRNYYSDLESIDSNWLIDHIDNAFEMWKVSKLANNLDFSEFKQFLLPYRYRNETLDWSSSVYRNSYYNILQPDSFANVDLIVKKINTYSTMMSFLKKDDTLSGHLGPFDLIKFNTIGCDRHSEWTARVLNSCGIPSVCDYTPSWRNRDRNHFWVAVRDSMGKFHPFTPMWQELHDSIYFNETSKVFRLTFEKQFSPLMLKLKGEEIPSTFENAFFKDVTDEYHDVTEFDISFGDKVYKNELVYLGIFSASGWKPIGWGKYRPDNNTAHFEKVPKYVIYVAGEYREHKLFPLVDPFYVDVDNSIVPLTANRSNLIDITVKRKFHEKGHLIDMMEEMVGAKIIGSNFRDFSEGEILHTLSKSDLSDMKLKMINLNSKKKYRYIKILSREFKKLNIGSFRLYGSSTKVIDRKQITYRSLDVSEDCKNLMDNNLETYVTAQSLEFELNTPTVISALEIVSRNSNNAVVQGDTYQLYYFDKEWVSAGVVRASSSAITFKRIPSNTLYWLRNLDRGNEEQAFLYSEGRQIFINEDNYIDRGWRSFQEVMSGILALR